MPPKRKRVESDVDKELEEFRKRGDLRMYRSGETADVALIMHGERLERLLLHRQLLISRVGKFSKLLAEGNELPLDRHGRTKYVEKDHDARAVRLVVDYVYGNWEAEIMEYQSENQPVIQDCILLFKLGHDFEIPSMIDYAIGHLEKYLSKKLKEICVYPLSKAIREAGRQEFLNDLQAGIKQAELLLEAKKALPWRMLVDFVVVVGPVLLREPLFHNNIEEAEGYLPDKFIKEILMGMHKRDYGTTWMKGLKEQSAKLSRPLPKKRGPCSSCGVAVARDETAVFSPFSQLMIAQRYPQICCEQCAEKMDKGDGKGVVWKIFDGVKEE